MKEMTFSDEKFMRLALKLARLGEGRVEPNPMVGCVVVKNGRIVAAGRHAFFGGPHAEAAAIGKALSSSATRAKLRGATLYVNLEPCRHTAKKTPPCVPLIIKSGVKKVVAGMLDPNPAVAGRGLQELRRAGIKTVRGVLEDDCRELNKVYVKNMTRSMPYVVVKSAMTLDGKIAASSGDSKWITSARSRALVHSLRSKCDAVLVGRGTVEADNPRLTARTPVTPRIGAGIGAGRADSRLKNPVRVIIDPSGRLPLSSKIFDGKSRTIIVTTASGAGHYHKTKPSAGPSVSAKSAALAMPRAIETMTLPPAPSGGFDFKKIMRELFARGIGSILVEGGGDTNWRAIKSGVVDEYIFFIAPKIIGGASAKTPVEGAGFDKIRRAAPLVIKKIFRSDGDVVIVAEPVSAEHLCSRRGSSRAGGIFPPIAPPFRDASRTRRKK